MLRFSVDFSGVVRIIIYRDVNTLGGDYETYR